MPTLKNPYEGLWKKHLSIDDMNVILEARMGGTNYGSLPILSTTDNEPIPANSGTTVSGSAGAITE